MGTPAEKVELEEQQPQGEMSDEDERAAFEQMIDEDPDLDDDGAPPQAPKLEEEDDDAPPPASEPPASKEQGEPERTPTGLEWLEELPEERRAAARDFIDRQGQTIARLDQRVRSHLGQLQPAQRALAQMQRKYREMQEQLGKQQQPNLPAGAGKSRKELEEWIDQEYADFPEEAAKLKARFTESLDGVLSVIPAVKPTRDVDVPVGPDPRQEIQHLATAYSDWGERRYSPEFMNWIPRQPDEVKQLLNSPFAADNIALLDRFTQDNPDWMPPQSPEEFHSLAQAKYSPLFRGWAEGEGINPDMNTKALPDYQRDAILTRFKQDLGSVLAEVEQGDEKGQKLRERRAKQLQNRDPGSRRLGVKPGQKIDLTTEEGQRAYFDQLVAADPDLKNR